jgi:hypothetical protein
VLVVAVAPPLVVALVVVALVSGAAFVGVVAASVLVVLAAGAGVDGLVFA